MPMFYNEIDHADDPLGMRNLSRGYLYRSQEEFDEALSRILRECEEYGPVTQEMREEQRRGLIMHCEMFKRSHEEAKEIFALPPVQSWSFRIRSLEIVLRWKPRRST